MIKQAVDNSHIIVVRREISIHKRSIYLSLPKHPSQPNYTCFSSYQQGGWEVTSKSVIAAANCFAYIILLQDGILSGRIVGGGLSPHLLR